MKRLLAVFLAILIGCTLVTPAFAEEGTQQLSPLVQNVLQSSANDDLNLLVTRSNYGYMQFVTNFRSSSAAQGLIQMTDGLIDTGYEPDETKYIEVLSNIILTYDYDNAADISEQAKLDDLKDFRDYAMDAKDATVDIVGLLSGNDEFGDALTVAVDGLSTLIDNTDEWIDALYDLDTILQDYSSYTFFLETVEQNSEGELRSAAEKMRHALSSILQTKLQTYNDVSADNFDRFSEFFASDLFVDLLKNTDIYESDMAVRCFADQAGEVIDALGILESSWDLGTLIGKTIGNVVVGGENLIRRVLEMEALFDISCALQTELPDLLSDAVQESDDSKVEQMAHLAQMLVNCHIRGEYCEYSIVASDAGLLSWANKGSAQEALEWYESQASVLISMEKRFGAILTSGIISGMVYAAADDSSVNAQSDVIITVSDSNGNVVRSEAISDTGGYSFSLPAGTYTVTAELEGHEPSSKEITLAAADMLNVDFEMKQNVINVADYFTNYEDLVSKLNMEPTECWQFFESDSYVADGFYLEWDGSIFSMKQETNGPATLYGFSVGDSAEEFICCLEENGWFYMYDTVPSGTYYGLLTSTGDQYLLKFESNDKGQLTFWYLNNWPEGEDIANYYNAELQGNIQEGTDWKSAYANILVDWHRIEDYCDTSYIEFYFEEDCEFDQYFLYDLNKDSVPELFLYSTTMGLTEVFTYSDTLIWCGLDDFAGINTATNELIVQGHWHGAGGSGVFEWRSYALIDNVLECTAYIDIQGDNYTIYRDGTNTDGNENEYNQIFSLHMADYTPFDEFTRYMLFDTAGLDNS